MTQTIARHADGRPCRAKSPESCPFQHRTSGFLPKNLADISDALSRREKEEKVAPHDRIIGALKKQVGIIDRRINELSKGSVPDTTTPIKSLPGDSVKPLSKINGLPAGWENTEVYRSRSPKYAVVSPQGNTFSFWQDEGSTYVDLNESGYRPSQHTASGAQYVAEGVTRNSFDHYEGNLMFEDAEAATVWKTTQPAEFAQVTKILSFLAKKTS